MIKMIEYKVVGEIADYMRNQRALDTSTCILVGAGVSVSAGIPDAGSITDDLRERYPEVMKKAKSDSYFACMSLLPEGTRRQLIRTYIENCRVNKSYLALAALVKEGFVDRILTTNFDPLIEKALLLCGCTPTVYDFGSSRKFISGAAGPRTLLYLHGRSDGFLLLNTEEEINSLTGRLRPVFDDSSQKRSLIIVGYSGNDNPVFNGIAKLKSYQHGLYWVGYKNQPPSARVEQEILRRTDAYFVAGETSDTFFEKLAASLKIDISDYSRPKVLIALKELDQELTNVGVAEAADVFDVTKDEIKCLAFKIYNERAGTSYLHRVFIRKTDFGSIEDEFKRNENINIIKTLINKRRLNLHLYKSHQFIPTVVGKDAAAMEQNDRSPAILHVQVSYVEQRLSRTVPGSIEVGSTIKPIELLLTKYIAPFNACGFLLDRTPKSGYVYSKAAEDLLRNKAYRKEVMESIPKFFFPFSHINISLAKREQNQLKPFPHSSMPKKLLRIVTVPERLCNYNCAFCCQTHNKSKVPLKKTILPMYCKEIVEAAVESGCQRVMLTGGEPLLCPENDLLAIVKAISLVDGINDFWICSNGSLLSEGICRKLKDNGLNKIVVTVAAETSEKYAAYTRQNSFHMDDILTNLSIAMKAGLRVKVDIPLSRAGIKNVKEFLHLISTLKSIGIREVAYFQLHKTDMNQHVYEQLFVDQEIITWELTRDNSWQIIERDNGQKVFYDGDMEIILPALMRHHTDNCDRNNCGHYCQGVYAAYLIPGKNDFVLRACHREVSGNTFRVTQSDPGKDGKAAIADVFKRVWVWAYQTSHPGKK